MSIKHIYEHLLEHFICLKSFIITAKFSCYALWAKSWSTIRLNSHWLQQQADFHCMLASIQIQYSLQQNEITGKHNTGQKNLSG